MSINHDLVGTKGFFCPAAESCFTRVDLHLASSRCVTWEAAPLNYYRYYAVLRKLNSCTNSKGAGSPQDNIHSNRFILQSEYNFNTEDCEFNPCTYRPSDRLAAILCHARGSAALVKIFGRSGGDGVQLA